MSKQQFANQDVFENGVWTTYNEYGEITSVGPRKGVRHTAEWFAALDAWDFVHTVESQVEAAEVELKEAAMLPFEGEVRRELAAQTYRMARRALTEARNNQVTANNAWVAELDRQFKEEGRG
jgi:hypothetical protein